MNRVGAVGKEKRRIDERSGKKGGQGLAIVGMRGLKASEEMGRASLSGPVVTSTEIGRSMRGRHEENGP